MISGGRRVDVGTDAAGLAQDAGPAFTVRRAKLVTKLVADS